MLWIVLRLYALKRWLSCRTQHLATKRVRVGIFALVGILLFRVAPAQAESLNVDSVVGMFASFILSLVSAIMFGIVKLIELMVPILTYNAFVDNPVVKNGWAIVRDTVNMFFVIILIIIAFGTIFGAERFKWQQQVPRLLIMAVVINFSKTLVGIMIDFGQVIMLTFANALREIAAGNMIQLFGLQNLYTISQKSSLVTSTVSEGISDSGSTFSFFASGILSLGMVIGLFTVLLIFIVILVVRIVMLWVLIVIAPLAWFAKGAEGIIESKAYGEWWSTFKCMVAIGPVLSFFLWLTLAVLGAGTSAVTTGFMTSEPESGADLVSKFLEPANILSYIIALAMFYAGFKMATDMCQGLGGQVLSKGVRSAASVAGLGFKAGSLGLRAGARVAAATPDLARGVARRLPIGSLGTAGRDLSSSVRKGAAGLVGQVGGKTFVGKWGRGKKQDIAQEARVAQFMDVNQEKEAMKEKGRPWMQQRILDNMKNPPSSSKGQAQDLALFENMMGDKRLQKDLGRDKVEALWKRHGSKYKGMAKGNAQKTANIEGFEKSNADFVLKGKNAQQKDAWFKEHMKDADDVNGLSDGAWQDKDVQDRAGHIQTTFKGKDGKKLNALEAAREGHYGVEAQKSALIKESVPAKEGSMDHMRRGVEVALAGGNKAEANKLVSQMGMEYHSTTDPAKKAEMLSVMDSTMGMLKGSKDSGAGSVLKRLSQVRDTAERVSPPPNAAKLQEGQNGEAYAEDMKNASAGRKANAVSRLTAQEVASNQEAAQAQTQRDTVVGDRKSAIEGELDALAKSLAQARINIDKELKDKLQVELGAVHSAMINAIDKKEELQGRARAELNPELKAKYLDESEKEEKKADALNTEYYSLSNSRNDDNRPAVEGDDRVKKIQIEIETKAGQLKNFNPEEIKEVKDLTNKIASLKEQIVQIKTARDKLK